MTRITGYDHLSLSVTDAAASAAWYVEVLGFVELRQVRGERFQRVILVHPDHQVALGLTCHDPEPGQERYRERFDEHRVGMDHVAFEVEGRRQLDTWKTRLEELRVDHSDVKEMANGALITLRDPDNVQLELRSPTTAA